MADQSPVVDTYKEYADWAEADRKVKAMLAHLETPSPPSFLVQVKVQGNFAMSTFYNQTKSDGIDRVISRVVRLRLHELLSEAARGIARKKEEAGRRLLRVAHDLVISNG